MALRQGPLSGVRVVEFGGIGPGPYCGQLLGDLGAEVLVVDREGGNAWPNPVTDRGKARLAIDLRAPAGREKVLAALAHADVLIEGFRPGVMERLGLGPEAVQALNPRLIYGRMTGWGQEGSLAKAAGHDLNYIALTGALAAIGPVGELSVPPLNLIGDFGGGTMFLAFGIVAALYERERSGVGQVIDAAIVDGVNSLMSFFAGMVATSRISMDRSSNLLGGAAPFYRCYRCADGKQVALASMEPHFYKEFLQRAGAPESLLAAQDNAAEWPAHVATLTALFATRTRDEWSALLEGTDACFAAVLEFDEVAAHPHMAGRQAYQPIDGVSHPAPAPRFSRTPGAITPQTDGGEMLAGWLDTVAHG